MYVVNGSDGRCIVAVHLIVGVRYLERPLREVLLYSLWVFNITSSLMSTSMQGIPLALSCPQYSGIVWQK